MDFMDMTLRQIFVWIPGHPVKVIMALLVADNILVSACASLGWIKAETFLLQISKLLYAIINVMAKKNVTLPKFKETTDEKSSPVA